MSSSQKWRWGATALLFLIACFAFWNTFKLWTMSDEEQARLQETNPGELLTLQQRAIRLGLDLQGGIHTVLRVKTEELEPAQREGAVDRAIQVLTNRIDGLGVAEPVIQKQGADRIIVDLPGYTDARRAEDLIGQTAVLEFKLLETYEGASAILRRVDSIVYARENEGKTAPSRPSDTAAKSADTAQSDDILSQLMQDTANDTLIDTLDFGFDSLAATVDERPFTSRLENTLASRNNVQWPGFTVSAKDRPLLDKWLNLPEVQRIIPADVQLLWSTRSQIVGNRETYDLYAVKRKVQFPGRLLENVALGREGNTGAYAVDFALSGDGAARFAQLTGANIDKPLAIVMDDKVESAPIINSKIRNSGQITMGGSASVQDARNLEIVLKAGALPAPVEIIEKNVVGATLGADSIRKGFTASVVGLTLMLAYVAFYYRLSGIIADLGLVFNLFFLLAVMAGLGATLTMPGIAGMILSIGMSVDSNVLIFERIREELRTGKTVRAAIDAGYDRAFTAILDSHVTTLITAGALFLFGSGAVRGFAVTLFWGVVISLFTAYVITRAIFDSRKHYKSLSI